MAASRPGFRPRLLMYLSFASLVLLFGVMLLGAYISSSNQGLACPDWPLCPNGLALPPERYFLEHTHRLVAAVTASVIILTAVYAWRNATGPRKTAIIAAAVASVQIVLGMFVVSTELQPLLVGTHLSTGVLLFAMTLMTFLSSYSAARNGHYFFNRFFDANVRD